MNTVFQKNLEPQKNLDFDTLGKRIRGISKQAVIYLQFYSVFRRKVMKFQLDKKNIS